MINQGGKERRNTIKEIVSYIIDLADIEPDISVTEKSQLLVAAGKIYEGIRSDSIVSELQRMNRLLESEHMSRLDKISMLFASAIDDPAAKEKAFDLLKAQASSGVTVNSGTNISGDLHGDAAGEMRK